MFGREGFVIWEGKSNFEVLKDILRNVIVFTLVFGLLLVDWLQSNGGINHVPIPSLTVTKYVLLVFYCACSWILVFLSENKVKSCGGHCC